MSDTKAINTPSLVTPYLHMRIAGKVIERKKTKEGKAKIIIAVPASDPFSHPSTFEISSDTAFAPMDAFVDVLVRVSSFAKNTNYKDEFGQPVKNRMYIFFLNYVSHEMVSE